MNKSYYRYVIVCYLVIQCKLKQHISQYSILEISVLLLLFVVVAMATNLCFSVDKGQLVTRVDLADAPTCALARGASVAILGNVAYRL